MTSARAFVFASLVFVACDRSAAPSAPDRTPTSEPAPASASPPPAAGAAPTTKAPLGPGCGGDAKSSGVSTPNVTISGKARAYTLVVPDAYQPDAPYPLVFVLHGGGGNAARARSQTDLEKAAAGKAIFVYPNAARGTWDLDGAASKNDDVALFDAILLSTHNTLCVDPKRVFVTGFSNGAYMANQLACRRGEQIRGVVTHAGGGPYELAAAGATYDASGRLQCPGKAVASLVVHGQSDGEVRPSEGQKSIDHWTYANRCGGGSAPAWTAPCVAFAGCAQPVGACKIPGLGHGLWKEAGRVTWSFFDALR